MAPGGTKCKIVPGAWEPSLGGKATQTSLSTIPYSQKTNTAKTQQKHSKNAAKTQHKHSKNSAKRQQNYSKNAAKIQQKYSKNTAKNNTDELEHSSIFLKKLSNS